MATVIIPNLVLVPIPASEPTIKFGADGGGLQTYTIATSEVKSYTGGFTGNVYAVTYDSIHDKLYCSGQSGSVYQIWRGNRNGSDVEVVLSETKCDWLTWSSLSYNVILWRVTNSWVSNTSGLKA